MTTETAVVRFERIGRNHNVPDMPIKGDPADLDSVAEQVFYHARHYLGSKWFEVTAHDDGAVLVEFGRFGRGKVQRLTSIDGSTRPENVSAYRDRRGDLWQRSGNRWVYEGDALSSRSLAALRDQLGPLTPVSVDLITSPGATGGDDRG